MWRDLRPAIRGLVKHPGFLAAGVLVLALGNGLNTAVFSVVNAILYRPPPVEAPRDLRYLYLFSALNRGPVPALSFRHFLELREHRDLFVDATLTGTIGGRIRTGTTIDRAQGERVASNYFELVGVQPLLGRPFAWDADDGTTAERVVIISHDLWRTQYSSDPGVLGKTLDLSSDTYFGAYAPWRRYTVVGVMPRAFKGMVSPWDATQYWVPFLRHAADTIDERRELLSRGRPDPRPNDFGGLAVVRLREDVPSAVVAARMSQFSERVRQEANPTEREWSFRLLDARRIRFPFDPSGDIVPGRLAAAVMCIAGIVLLIAAGNLAGMVLARGVSRRSELALRLTLGATRARLMRQLTAESLLLSTAGCALGLLLARWLVDLFVAAIPSRFEGWQVAIVALDVPIDWRVVVFSVSSCLVTGILVGLLPARRVLSADLLSGLAGQSVSTTPATRTPLQRWIVVPQVCLSLVLLLLAGTLARTMTRAEMRWPGYDATGVVMVDVDTRAEVAATSPRREARAPIEARTIEHLARIQRLKGTAEAVRGVTSVTVVSRTPMMSLPFPSMNGWIAARDGFAPDGRHVWAARMDGTPGYFATLRIPLLRGRDFGERDRRNAHPVAIVSETLSRALWPQTDPVGQYLGGHEPNSAAAPKWLEVIGVVGDVRLPLASDAWSPAYYVPTEQAGFGLPSTIVARGDRATGDLIQGLTKAVMDAEPDALPLNGRLMSEGIGQVLYPRRVATAVLALAGVIGLVLASSGLYGLISYSVVQRVREIGVRMALGADRADILRLIVREGATVSIVGMVLGFGLTYVTFRVASRWIVPLPPMDLTTLAVVPLLIASVILVACYLPALRAARVDPIEVLRGL